MNQKRHILIFAVVAFSMSQCSGNEMNERTANYFTQKLSHNLLEQYNSHVLRLRRAAQRAAPPSISTMGMKFKVGACAIEDFLHSAKNCSTVFYTSVRARGSSRNRCGDEYKKLRKCMLDTLTNCIEDSRVSTYLNKADVKEIKNNFLVFLGNREFWCDKGGLGISSDYLPAGSMCDPVFYQISEGCTTSYSKLFNSSASDEKLCGEYKRAKKCYLQTLFLHCSFSRMLRQMLEIMIEIAADFQPFCKTTPAEERLKLEDLFLEKTCPPYSLADVAFLLDVTNGTTRGQFIAMKRVIEGTVKKMNYGWKGIQVSIFQFDTHLRTILKFGRAPTKALIQRYVRRMSRTTTRLRNKARRMTGRSLSALGRSTFSPNKGGDVLVKKPWKSGQRPHNTAAAFVFTSGPSLDSMVPGLELLDDRNVHVAFVGPKTLKVPTTSNKLLGTGIYRVIETDFKFREVGNIVKGIVEEICNADRRRQFKSRDVLAEGHVDNSKWGNIQRLLSRFGEYDLSLLFELRPIVAPLPQTSSSVGYRPSSSPALPYEDLGPSEGMDGDSYWGGSTQNTGLTQWPFYMSENEYIEEIIQY